MSSNYRLLSAIFFVYFMAWSFSFSLFPIWLSQEVGLSGEEVGIVFSINSLMALFIMPYYGIFQDKLGLKKTLLYFIVSFMLLIGPFVNYVYEPLLHNYFYVAVVLGGLVFSFAFLAGVGVLESYIDKQSRIANFEFGKARMWGSFGWALASYFTGLSFNLDPNLNYWLSSIAAVCLIGLLFFVKVNLPNQDVSQPCFVSISRQCKEFIEITGLWRLSVFVVGVSCIYGVFDQQFAIYYTTFFATQELGREYFGYLTSAQVILEAFAMYLAVKWVNKLGVKSSLLLSGVLMALRIYFSGVVEDAWGISFLKLTHAIELPLMLIALFKYINMHFEAKYSAMIYIIGFQFTVQLMASILAIIVGGIYDQLGYALTYQYLGMIVCVFIVVSCFVLKADIAKKNLV
ncbi:MULTISPECIES: oligosaccharide MFS transporter [Pseudoalteromonas]|uniref:oligosaccharide MFS transporter n=1 Tax=Pseudoalteromonas TaxID=53246 RepID=UPI0003730104|nr:MULTISPECIES: oligosaccharide MFS transporter [Pseudoalteromonas]MCF6146384.1 MFS transporter, OHS family, lactose permease [Pseudoalteromonas mariniglutinosa NCIMB 1770]TMN63815.1 MFS transporter [Pseudoalteromonas sp. S1727]